MPALFVGPRFRIEAPVCTHEKASVTVPLPAFGNMLCLREVNNVDDAHGCLGGGLDRTTWVTVSTSLVSLDDQAVVAVLGLAGSGKSSFINQCVGSDVTDAGSRLSSITQKPRAYKATVNGINVCLVDTPGFDDTHVSDVDSLLEISLYLTDLYKAEINLTAIIYLQDIRLERIGGVALKNIHILESLTGLENFGAIVFSSILGPSFRTFLSAPI